MKSQNHFTVNSDLSTITMGCLTLNMKSKSKSSDLVLDFMKYVKTHNMIRKKYTKKQTRVTRMNKHKLRLKYYII